MINDTYFIEALNKIITFDTDVLHAVYISLLTSIQALVLSSLFSFPLALYLIFCKEQCFYTKIVRHIIDTMLSIPTVLLGLLGYILFSHQGIFSYFSLLYTTSGMSIILAILAFPLLTSLIITGLEDTEEEVLQTSLTLGASYYQAYRTLLWEKRNYIIVAYITTGTRLLSEVGIAMMVGGNIKNHTRTITTTIALETGKGNFSLCLALGIVLLVLSSSLTMTIRMLQKKS